MYVFHNLFEYTLKFNEITSIYWSMFIVLYRIGIIDGLYIYTKSEFIIYCTLVYCTLVYCTIADRSDRFATSISLREHANEHLIIINNPT